MRFFEFQKKKKKKKKKTEKIKKNKKIFYFQKIKAYISNKFQKVKLL
jgi:hypothetical protein